MSDTTSEKATTNKSTKKCNSFFSLNKKDKQHLPWLIFLLGNALGLGILCFYWHEYLEIPEPLFSSVVLLVLITTSLAVAPLIRFVMVGWEARRHEFLNRLNGDALTAYLQQFWEIHTRDHERFGFIDWKPSDETVTESDKKVTKDQIKTTMEKAFDAIYSEQYGRSAFIVPIVLLIAIIFISTVLSVLFYLDLKQIIHIRTLDISAKIAIASMAGAYMYVVSNIIQSVRQRSLNTSDIYWHILRMLLAIPIGFALTSPMITNIDVGIRPFVAFGLGTLPMDQIIKVLSEATRKILPSSFKVDEKSDKLIKLTGVTNRVASILTAEGVDSIEQIITVDPVLLSIRTGFSFKFILQLGSQAIVRRHLGKSAKKLIQLGLADAKSISALVADLDNDKEKNLAAQKRAKAVLKFAASRIVVSGGVANDTVAAGVANDTVAAGVANDTVAGGVANDTVAGGVANDTATVTSDYSIDWLEFNFRQIADENYTQFILGNLLDIS